MDENEEGSSISVTKENTEPISVKNVADEIDQIDIQEKPCTDTKENECLTDFISDDKTASACVSSGLEEKDESEQDCDKSSTPNEEKPHTIDSNKNLDNNIVLATQTETSNKTHSDESAVEAIEATDLKSIDIADAERADAHTSNAASVPIGKTVGLADTEEGELDYEEEEIQVNVDQQADHEEGEIMDDKDIEGSEEGEIVSDNEGEQTSTKKDGHEEGEINDYDLEEGQLDEAVERGHRPRTLCKYYDAGTCRWGVACRFLHPGINDKGNYLMHRPPGMYPTAFGKPPPPNEMGPLNPIMPRSTVLPSMHAPGFMDNVPLPVDLERPPAGPKKESAWERGLKKAKEIKLTSQKRREEDDQFEEKRMNLSIKETQKEPDRPSPTIRRDQWRPGYERESQNEKFTPRSRPADYRQEANERRFNRNRKSPPKRYEQERERNNKGHEFERDKPRDMDRERFLRLQRRRSPTPPERRHERERNRERERDKPDARRDRRIDARTDPHAERGKENYIEDVERNEKPQVSVEETKKPTEPAKEEQIAAPVTKTLEAEQWRDPWMRTQSQPIKSPERISPLQRSPIAEDIVSGDSSGTDSESDSDDSEESGSESGSESKESSDAEEEAEKIEEAAKPPLVTAASKEPPVSSPQSALVKDPRLKEHSSKDSTPKRDSPQLAKESNRSAEKGYHQRSHRDPRDYDKRRRPDEPQRRGRDRSAERERRHRDRTDGPSQNANSFPQWRGPHHVDAGWQRGGYHQFMQNNYRGMPDRRTESRRHEDDPRLIQGDRARGRRRSRSKSPRSAPYPRKTSSLRDPRRGATDHGASTDKDRKQPNQDRRGPSPSSRNYSPQQKDPRLPYVNSSKRREEDKKTKDVTKNDRNAEPKEKREIKSEAVVEEAKKPETKPATAHSDVSEDEFESPKYGDSGSGSDSDSDTGSESGSDSEAGSELASASPSGSANEASNSESEGDDSASNSDKLSASSNDEVSNSKKKELEKKKKDFKMVLSMAKTSTSSSKGNKAQNTPKGSITTKPVKDHSDRSDPRLQIGQKRSLSDHSSSNASPKGGSSKTAARKNELLKELKAIEDAIARKRAKID